MRMQPRPEKLTTEELGQIAGLDAAKLDMLAAWANKKLTCAHCKRCTLRCEVLKEPDLDMGQVEEGYGAIAALPFDDQPAAVLQLVQDRPELYHALRRCCFCGFCTATCQTHVLAPERMRDWRVLFMRAGLMPPDDSKLVMVDNEWNIFSAYRAVYGIGYPELASLEQAAEHGPGLVDTLFFPGCSLVSYAPELTRTVGRWLTDNGVAWALSTDCCGSPLMSAGLFDRAAALRQRILDQIRAAGIVRVVTVCPGCGEEFVELMGDEVDIVLPKAQKTVVYLCAVAGALAVFVGLGQVFGGGGGLPRFTAANVGAAELAWLVPLALAGTAAGWVFHASGGATQVLARKMGARPVAKSLLAGAILGLCGMALPYTMFAGEVQATMLQTAYVAIPAAALIATGFVKAAVTPLCINLGWRGGHFFPVIFSGISLGYGFALVSGVDPVFCVAACTAALMGAVMRQPLMAALLLIMCFPLKGVVVMLTAATIGAAIPLPKALRVN